jgi:mRNA-degrading endonuclease RelE of RelBE toxin-antitoxin system
MHTIEFVAEARVDLESLRKFDQVRVIAAIENQLIHEPTQVTRNRKRLRPNQLAEWVLRVENIRIFYDVIVDPPRVKIVAIGQKEANDLYIRGEKFEL